LSAATPPVELSRNVGQQTLARCDQVGRSPHKVRLDFAQVRQVKERVFLALCEGNRGQRTAMCSVLKPPIDPIVHESSIRQNGKRNQSQVEKGPMAPERGQYPYEHTLFGARRFPPPWSVVEENAACFIVRDSEGKSLALL
jgi:hypothetical protein